VNVVKKIDLEIKHDLFALAVLKDFVVCGSENRDLKIFDKSLNKLGNIFLIDDMAIHVMSKNFLKNEVILYCADNECFIWVDIATHDYKIISIDISNHNFGPAFYWDDDYAIVENCTGHFYELDIKKGCLSIVSDDIIKIKYPQLDRLIDIGRNMGLLSVSINNGYIVKESRDGSSVSIITLDSIRKINPPTFPYHNIVYEYGITVFVGETKIQVVNEHDQIFILFPQKGYNFLIVEPRKDGQRLELVVLSGYLPDHRYSLINVYGVCN